MERVQHGDTDAFGQLYDRHAKRAFQIARATCRDRSHAEDAVREGFLAIWRSRADYRPDAGSFRAWSMRIVQNKAIDASPDPLLGALQRLPKAQAEVIALAFHGHLSHAEIAKQLDLPPGAIKGRMRLGLEKLRQEMDAPD